MMQILSENGYKKRILPHRPRFPTHDTGILSKCVFDIVY